MKHAQIKYRESVHSSTQNCIALHSKTDILHKGITTIPPNMTSEGYLRWSHRKRTQRQSSLGRNSGNSEARRQWFSPGSPVSSLPSRHRLIVSANKTKLKQMQFKPAKLNSWAVPSYHVAHDMLHVICTPEHTCWRHFAVQWGDCKKKCRFEPINDIIIIINITWSREAEEPHFTRIIQSNNDRSMDTLFAAYFGKQAFSLSSLKPCSG